VKLRNEGALPTRVFVKTSDGRSIQFVNQDELQKKIDDINRKNTEEQAAAVLDQKELENSNDIAAQEDADFAKEAPNEERARLDNEAASKKIAEFKADPFEEFLA